MCWVRDSLSVGRCLETCAKNAACVLSCGCQKKCGGRETHIYSLVVLEVRSLKSLSWAEVNRLAEPVPSFRRLRGDSGSQPFPGLEAPCICWLVAAPLIAPDSRFYQHISFILLRLFCLPLVRTLIFGLTWVIAADLPSSRSLT